MRFSMLPSTLLVLSITACSSDPVPVTTAYSMTVNADDTINKYQSDSANPVVVRLYQLASKESFEQSSFITLYNTDHQALGSSLVVKQVLPSVMPDSNQTISLDINKNTQYIAALVEYANYRESNGKAVTAVPTDGESSIALRLSGLNVELDIVAPESSWWQIF
ncbi:type VI secretion system lipoprotein TssJ [Vibrio barjaei]|uniref:type VI secretion system lipoprotein TssJ n=1 Tax=Vibrio barjaei TaxID=1676683 RepID=UPI0007C5CB87|nr:type VI secretion system lipoprotein TssJ [Vibrio barjaei]OIN25659.1 type VI secretion system-associated lipoprotein [Vibrio barjaei]